MRLASRASHEAARADAMNRRGGSESNTSGDGGGGGSGGGGGGGSGSELGLLHNLESEFWENTFLKLNARLVAALHESNELDEAGKATSAHVVGEVLQASAIKFMRDTQRELFKLELANRCRGECVPLELRDFWGLSSLTTLIATENEDGRRWHAFPQGSQFLARTGSTLDNASWDQMSELQEHPRGFIAYAFTANLSGRRFLESEARALWADSVATPVCNNRRYSEFHALWQELSHKFRYRIGASSHVRLIVVPPLPPKSSWSPVSATSVHFVNERRRALDIWLRYVAFHRIMSLSAPFRRFVLEPVGINDAATADSASVGSAGEVPQLLDVAGLSTPTSRALIASRDDPLVARRARQQVDEVLALYGSGPIALSAVHSILPALQNAAHGAKLAVRALLRQREVYDKSALRFSQSLLRLSQTDQQGGRKGRRPPRLRLDPINYMGIGIKRCIGGSAPARASACEALHCLQHTLRLWSKHMLPQMRAHVGHLYSSDIVDSQAEERAGVTPQERVAAEWLEMSQVRCCMLTKGAEDVVQSQIMLASKRRAMWQALKERLVRFDADDFLQQLSRGSDSPLSQASSVSNSYSEVLRAADRRAAADVEADSSFGTTTSYEARETLIIEQQREEGEARRLESEAESRRPPPPVPRPAIPRRASQQAIRVTGTPAVRATRARCDTAPIAVVPAPADDEENLRSANHPEHLPPESGKGQAHQVEEAELPLPPVLRHTHETADKVATRKTVTFAPVDEGKQQEQEQEQQEQEQEQEQQEHQQEQQQEQQEQQEPDTSNWVAAETEDGIPYYFHAVTRASRWLRPAADVERAMEKRIESEQQAQEQRTEERVQEIERERQAQAEAEERRLTQSAHTDKVVGAWVDAAGHSLSEMLISLHQIAGELPSFVQERPFDEAEKQALRDGGPERRKEFLRALRTVHPDKLAQHSPTLEQTLLAERLFNALMEAGRAQEKLLLK